MEENRRALGKLGRREDPRFYRNAKDKIEKSLGTKPKEEERWDKVLNILKDLKLTVAKNDKSSVLEKPPFNKFNRPLRLQDYPYNINWKDGKPFQ